MAGRPAQPNAPASRFPSLLGRGPAYRRYGPRVPKPRMKRRILMVINAEWYFLSHRLALPQALQAQGYEVLIAASVERNAQALIESHGLRFLPLDLRRRSTGLRQELRTLLDLCRLYRLHRPDLVHHVTMKPIIYGSLAARVTGVPAVINAITGLGSAFQRPGLRGALLRRGLTRACQVAFRSPRTRLIFQNPDDLAWFVRRGLVDEKRVILIRGAGVDIDRFQPGREPSGVPLVVMASRLLWDKGVGEFVGAARRLRSIGLSCRFALVGAPDDENPNSIPVRTLDDWQRQGIVEWWGFQSD